MAKTLVKINIHLVFHVKSTSIKIAHDDQPRLFQYLGGIIRDLGGIPMAIGGMSDHVHILTTLPKTMALSDFVKAIKAESSKWIKNVAPSYHTFAWQEGYGAFSVSPSVSTKTTQYILNQEEHHKKRSFQEEYKLFLSAYGIQYDEKYAFSD